MNEKLYNEWLTHQSKDMAIAQTQWEKKPIHHNEPHEHKKRVYLAIPYTFNPVLSHKIANKITADLMQKGHVVFSPISHSHHIADHLPDLVRTDSDWWMIQDLPFIEWADEVHVVCIGEMGQELISGSKGVQMEILHATKHNKPVKIIEYYV